MTVQDVLNNMSWAEFLGWLAFHELENEEAEKASRRSSIHNKAKKVTKY